MMRVLFCCMLMGVLLGVAAAQAPVPMPQPKAPAAEADPAGEGAPQEEVSPQEAPPLSPAAPRILPREETPGKEAGNAGARGGEGVDFARKYPELPAGPGFTPDHAAYFRALIEGRQEEFPEAAADSAVFAGRALAKALAALPPDTETARAALAWLDGVYALLNTESGATVQRGLSAAFREHAVRLDGALKASPESDMERVQCAMQACLSLALYGDAALLKQWVAPPDALVNFYRRTGALLYDGGVLDSAQFESLATLFEAVPPALHGIAAVMVPEGMGMSSAEAGLSTPGYVLDITAVPMGVYSPPELFLTPARAYSVPDFALQAAVQVTRAVQALQFGRRPELAQRRAAILATAGPHATRYLRQDVSPLYFQQRPEEFLPLTAALWFADSTRAFDMAIDFMRLRENESLDALLLLADLFSGGGDTTLVFQISPEGRVQSGAAPLRRTLVAPGIAFVSGIGIGGTLWTFEFNAAGGVAAGRYE
jgi:hypothetical protein